MTVVINGTTGITFPDNSVQYNSYYGFKNRIINGAMVIDQRNAGASVTPFNGQYLVDRWFGYQNNGSKYSAQQTTTAPAGFINSLKATSLSAYSVGSTDVYTLSQAIEGLNIADLAWGTASAATITLSFRVYSSLTGTFGGSLMNSNSSRAYPFTYSIPVANTWSTISVTIAGDQSGTWLTTNGVGIYVFFGIGVGSTYSGTAGSWAGAAYYSATGATSVVGTNGATFYITGVQLEKGSTATSFDYRPYGTELALCQRYYEKSYDIGTVVGAATNNGAWMFIAPIASSNHRAVMPFAVRKRTTPSTQYWDLTGASTRQSTFSLAANTQTDGVNGISSIQAYEANLWLNFVTGATPVSVALHWVVSSEL
jgi:hypothetical protein